MQPEDRVNILLVDDKPEDLLALEAVLERLGERLVRANSGKEASKRLQEDDFAVILLDAQMPDMDGLETATLIRSRERSKNTPIIFLTATHLTDAHISRGYSLGPVDYIFEPFEPDVLRSKVAVFADLFRKTRQDTRLNETLERRVLALEAANEELRSFSYSVAHDLRAPLRAVSGFAQILDRRHRANLNEEGQHYLNNILGASVRMEHMIEDLLAYSRLGYQALRYQMVSLSELFTHLLDSMAPRIAEAGAVIEVQRDLPEVSGCHTLLEQLFTNLMDNALTYRRPKVPPRISVGWARNGDDYVFRVCDNGIGIAPENREKIFHLFQRLHSYDEYPGTGLGLATVRKAAEMMGGRVWVESRLGVGSTFCVQLPRRQDGSIQSSAELTPLANHGSPVAGGPRPEVRGQVRRS